MFKETTAFDGFYIVCAQGIAKLSKEVVLQQAQHDLE